MVTQTRKIPIPSPLASGLKATCLKPRVRNQPIDKIEFGYDRRRKNERINVPFAHGSLEGVKGQADRNPGVHQLLSILRPIRVEIDLDLKGVVT